MIVLAAGALLLVLVVAVGVALVGAAVGAARDGGRVGASLAVPAAVVGGLAVLLVLAVLGLGAARSAPPEEPDAAAGTASVDPKSDEDAETAPGGAEATAAPAEPSSIGGAPARFDGVVAVDGGESPLRPLPVVAGLAEAAVVEVRGDGFVDRAEGVVAQCDRVDARVCRNVLPVVTDEAGRVRVPYRLEGPASGRLVVVEVDLDRGAARLAFGAWVRSTAPTVSVADAGRTVVVRGAAPGERISVLRCPTDVGSLAECRAVARPSVSGTGSATVEIDPGARDGAPLIAVLGRDGTPLAEPVRVDATPRPRVDVTLEPARLFGGFGMAMALMAVALVLLRTTDWRAPAEAATPSFDETAG